MLKILLAVGRAKNYVLLVLEKITTGLGKQGAL